MILRTNRIARQQGVAIVLAMGTLALAAMTATAIMVTQSTWARSTELAAQRIQAQAVVDAGVDWARAVLSDDRRTSNVDHLGEPWALRLSPMPVENGMIAGYLEDEQARFNLNNLVAEGKVNSAQFLRFLRLLLIVGINEVQARSLADALVDWIDADSEAQPRGVEDEYYLAMQPPYLPANRALIDMNELAHVRGFDEAVRNRLRPFVSALPRSTTVNVNTAPPEVLAAIIDGLSIDDARLLVARRQRIYFRESAGFLDALPIGASRTEGISVSSDYFRVWLQANIGEAEASGSALLARQDTRWPTIVWRKLI